MSGEDEERAARRSSFHNLLRIKKFRFSVFYRKGGLQKCVLTIFTGDDDIRRLH